MLDTVKTVVATNRTYLDKVGTAENEGNRDLMVTVKDIINVALGVIGVVAVVMIILGGITYTTSQGDAAKVKKGKDTILYGVIGLVVALLAFAIVNFVLGNVFGGGSGKNDTQECEKGYVLDVETNKCTPEKKP